VFAQYFHDAPPGRPASLVFCGGDADAKAVAARLIEDVGFEPVDAGGSD
jgi:8-hydroxy-5-deazaflavin:NADPH oxidoreductase